MHPSGRESPPAFWLASQSLPLCAIHALRSSSPVSLPWKASWMASWLLWKSGSIHRLHPPPRHSARAGTIPRVRAIRAVLPPIALEQQQNSHAAAGLPADWINQRFSTNPAGQVKRLTIPTILSRCGRIRAHSTWAVPADALPSRFPTVPGGAPHCAAAPSGPHADLNGPSTGSSLPCRGLAQDHAPPSHRSCTTPRGPALS